MPDDNDRNDNHSDRYARGAKTRRAVLGDDYVDQAQANTTDFDADFQQFITETAWGSVWARPHLDHRTRHLLTLALLAAAGHDREFALHLRATRHTGVTPEDVKEMLLQVAVYAGIPAANSAVIIAKQVYQEMMSEEEPDDRSETADVT